MEKISLHGTRFILFHCYTYRVKIIKKRKKKRKKKTEIKASYAILTIERPSVVHRAERKISNTIKRTFRVTVCSLLYKVVSKQKPRNDVVSMKRNVFKKFARDNIYKLRIRLCRWKYVRWKPRLVFTRFPTCYFLN